MRRYKTLSFPRWRAACLRLAEPGGSALSTTSRVGALAACLGLLATTPACGPRSSMPAGYAGDDARAFIVKHRAELQEEIAAGSGPRIYDLAIIANCQDVPALGRRLHRHREDFFQSAGAAADVQAAAVASPASGATAPGGVAAGVSAPGGAAPGGAAPDGTAPGGAASGEAPAHADAEVADRIVRFMSERRELRCLSLDLSRTREMAAGTRHIGPRRGPTTARGGTP